MNPSFLRRTLEAAASGVLVLALVAASSARADVRVDDGGPEPTLRVQVTPAGPWTPVAEVDEHALNVEGDAFADGLPGQAVRADDLLAAWLRPADGRLMSARWDGVEWQGRPAIDAPGAQDVPKVHAIGDGWALTWQASGRWPAITVAGADDDGNHTGPIAILPGWLLDAQFSGDVQVLLTLTPDRRGLLATGVLWSVPGVPSPIDIAWQVPLRRLNGSGNNPWPPGLGAIQRAPQLEASTWDGSLLVTWVESGRLISTELDVELGEVTDTQVSIAPRLKLSRDVD